MIKSITFYGKKKEKTVSNTNYMMVVINDVYTVPTEQEGFRGTGAGTGGNESPYGYWELH